MKKDVYIWGLGNAIDYRKAYDLASMLACWLGFAGSGIGNVVDLVSIGC